MKIWIAGLVESVTEEDLTAAFEQHNLPVRSARVIRDRETQESRGFGFVTFATEEAYQKALKMNGYEWYHKRLTIRPAHDRAERSTAA